MVRKYLGRAVENVGNFNKGMRDSLGGYADVAADATVGTAKLYNKVMPLTKKTDPGIQNLWTGRREGRGLIGLGAVAGVGYGMASYHKQTTFAPRTGEVSYSGTAPIMDADGVGSKQQAPTLGAGGNMVFGLHNARKG